MFVMHQGIPLTPEKKTPGRPEPKDVAAKSRKADRSQDMMPCPLMKRRAMQRGDITKIQVEEALPLRLAPESQEER